MNEIKSQKLPAWRRIGTPIVAVVAVLLAAFVIVRTVKSLNVNGATVSGATDSANQLHKMSSTTQHVVPKDIYAAFRKKAIGMGGAAPKK